MGIDGYVPTPVGSYSSGMLKKLSLLLAFLGKPQLILAVQLLLMALSMVVVLHTFTYYIGLNMDKYLQW